MLSPLTPDQAKRSSVGRSLGEIRWAVLDCCDACRRKRLAARATEEQIEEALSDAALLRTLGFALLSSDNTSVESTAHAIAEWANGSSS